MWSKSSGLTPRSRARRSNSALGSFGSRSVSFDICFYYTTFISVASTDLQLAASDSLLTGSALVLIRVQPANHAPVVDAGQNQTITNAATTQLSGSVQDDGIGALIFSWSMVSGPAAVAFSAPNQLATSATFTKSGSYLLRLTANDTFLSDAADVTITITVPNPGNQPPVVNAGADQTVIAPSATLALTGTASDDGLPAGSSLTYQWSKLSGPAAAD